ncbi:MAG: anthranilate synthase component I family protein [Bdellovibrionales bacterium]|nr:anthranilate synthase component I family protein [Bdellovibrionales bacterium]
MVRALGLEPGQYALWEQLPNDASHQAAGFAPRAASRFRYAVLGLERSLTVQHGTLRTTGEDQAGTRLLSEFGANVFAPVEDALAQWHGRADRETVAAREHFELPPFIGGLIGFVGYDTARYLEKIHTATGHAIEPDICLYHAETILVQDIEQKQLLLISWNPQSHEAVARRIEKALPAAAKMHSTDAQNTHAGVSRSRFSTNEFVARVQSAKEYILAGDIFQVVLANTFTLNALPDPLALYEELCRLNPSPYHFAIPFGSHCLVGASPELMLRCRNISQGKVQAAMRLVAGTYPRREGAFDEQAQRARLLADEKERAEHIMLVDHARNDIGRVAEIGSVSVDELLAVEPYRDVLHLVSQVSGVLRAGESAFAALRACFPIATLTGTPKIRAMEIIAELEGPSRGVFGGCALLAGHDGFLDSGVIIRSAVVGPDGVTVRAGAGIVADSLAEREDQECRWKANAVLRAAEAVACRKAA